MDNSSGVQGNLQIVFTAEQIGQRVRELARQIADDFRGRTICTVCVMENGFVFMADLIRQMDHAVLCQFIRSDFTDQGRATEIFFSPEPKVEGLDVLLIEGVLKSGLTTEFLLRNLLARGAKSVKVVALLDRRSERQVAISADYAGFEFEGSMAVGYGMGSPDFGRNLPYIAALERTSSVAGGN